MTELTLKELADRLDVSKSFLSRRARAGEPVKGRPVHEWMQTEEKELFGETKERLDVFLVPEGALDGSGVSGGRRSVINPERGEGEGGRDGTRERESEPAPDDAEDPPADEPEENDEGRMSQLAQAGLWLGAAIGLRELRES